MIPWLLGKMAKCIILTLNPTCYKCMEEVWQNQRSTQNRKGRMRTDNDHKHENEKSLLCKKIIGDDPYRSNKAGRNIIKIILNFQ
mgnify:CR=1 FL=1